MFQRKTGYMERRGLEFTLKPRSLPQSTYECCIDGKTSDMHESSMNANKAITYVVTTWLGSAVLFPAPFTSCVFLPSWKPPRTHPVRLASSVP